MGENRNTSPFAQRRAQTFDYSQQAGGSADPYDGTEDQAAIDSKRSQSFRHSSESLHTIVWAVAAAAASRKGSCLWSTMRLQQAVDCFKGTFIACRPLELTSCVS